jgi:hypothetical protein
MTSPLVTGGFIALKSKLTGKYVRYMPYHGEGGKKNLQASAEDAASPFTRFQAEPSKEHDDGGYVHLRCCYNGRYWVARQVGDEWCLSSAKPTSRRRTCSSLRARCSGVDRRSTTTATTSWVSFFVCLL